MLKIREMDSGAGGEAEKDGVSRFSPLFLLLSWNVKRTLKET